MFTAIGIMTAVYAKNRSSFAMFMIIGLMFSWIGDLFLHIKGKKYFIIGFLAFASAHIFYLTAYSRATSMYFPERKFLQLWEIITALAIEIVLIGYYRIIHKMSLKSEGMIAAIVYGLVLIPMTLKAVVFSYEFIKGGFPNAVYAGICLAGGSVLFFLSDTSLVLLMFNEKFTSNHRLKDYNIVTYFLGQTLLGLSMLFVGV